MHTNGFYDRHQINYWCELKSTATKGIVFLSYKTMRKSRYFFLQSGHIYYYNAPGNRNYK